jgi:hypothetical protein
MGYAITAFVAVAAMLVPQLVLAFLVAMIPLLTVCGNAFVGQAEAGKLSFCGC